MRMQWITWPTFLVVSFLFSLPFITSADPKKKSSSSSSSGSKSSTSKSVQVKLNAKWSQTPLYLEVAHHLAEESEHYFWSYLDDLEADSSKLETLTDAQRYELALKLAAKYLRSEAKLDLLRFTLSLRSYSPTVSIFKQITDDIRNQNEHLRECDAFVEMSHAEEVLPRFLCGLEQIQEALKKLKSIDGQTTSLLHPLIYSVDRVFSSGQQITQTTPTVILYAPIGSPVFYSHHHYLKSEASKYPIRYVIRHLPDGSGLPVVLSGYGVELAIKSTEYKAQDDTRVRGEAVIENLDNEDESGSQLEAGFDFGTLKTRFGDLTEKLDEFRKYLIDNEKEIATLKVWELQEISLQAATKILSVQKEKALQVLSEISQDFPAVARSLVKINVESDLRREISRNQHLILQQLNLATSDTALFVNGLYHDIESVDIFTLFETIRSEYLTVSKLHALLGSDMERIRKFVKLDLAWEKQELQLDIRDGSIIWINDIESDKMYRNWPSSLHEMLRPTYPGMLRNVRKNMYHLVLIVDPAKKESFDVLRMAESFYIHKAPVRIGLVFAVNPNPEVTGLEDAGVACLEAFNYLSQEKSPYDGLSFLTDVIAYATSTGTRDLEPEDVIYHLKSKMKLSDMDDILGPDSSYDTGRRLAAGFLEKTGLEHGPKALVNGVLLKEAHLNADYFEDAVLSEIMKQTTPLQKAIYKGQLGDGEDVLEWLMSKPTVMPRINKVLLGLDGKQSNAFVDLSLGTKSTESNYLKMNVQDLQATLASSLKYINTKKDCNPVTVWLASDFESPASLKVLHSALVHLRESSRALRLSLVYRDHNPITRILESASGVLGSGQLLQWMYKFTALVLENPVEGEDLVKKASELVPEDHRKEFLDRHKALADSSASPFGLHQVFTTRSLSLAPGSMALILNGKVYKVPETKEDGSPVFIEADFALVERFVSNMVSEKVLDLLSEAERSSGTRKCSDLVLKITTALMAKAANSKQRYDLSANIEDDHSVLLLEPKQPDAPFVELTAVLDPLTRGAQKIAPILEVLSKVFNARVRIYFNCVEKHSDMPLRQFYRFVLDTEPRFDSEGNLEDPVALFKNMPKTPLLTLGMAVPENWLVESVDAVHDLDNIHLEEVSTNQVSAVFELEHLLVEGHCFEQSTGSPPRGLQFTLGTQRNPVMVDTIVMANLGYFQLKANPGIWALRLRQGRSEEIYTIVSHDNTDQVANSTEVIPVVSSFRSLVLKIRVNKKPGKQNEELLYDSDESASDDSNGWFSWNGGSSKDSKAKSTSGGDGKSEDADSKRLNIFSLASGHLYERLLRIMMMSVLKNTETPVKFWFLKNYLSPSFKKSLPVMAQKYDFEYELVQYKWPRWLHQQTEKQRIIWGYKILFLDVLFPLDVKKIIFVDADQVVRADLKELRDLDLEGAPYGYTPFCDSRHDMDGFRFWKQGYWATHLHGRKYHISALYVVDLQKFRRIAAGDRLRGQYQGLSQDPNSLSNLDQDLPNNMIHQVAIKSLPQEWLWCETWCDDESKSRAKTIDLCNNPKTKEPKLTAARRIIAEWESYDREIRQLLESNQTSVKVESKQRPEVEPDLVKHSQQQHKEHQEL